MAGGSAPPSLLAARRVMRQVCQQQDGRSAGETRQSLPAEETVTAVVDRILDGAGPARDRG
jgi:hypothetical protein